MIAQAVQAIITSLQAMPGGMVPPSRIGIEAPNRRLDLPALRIRPEQFRVKPVGIGGIIRSRALSATQWEESTGSQAEGRLLVEAYTETAVELLTLVAAVAAHFEAEAPALRAAGFLRLGSLEWRPEERIQFGTNTNSPRFFLQALSFAVIFESLHQETPGPDGIIERIEVTVKPPVEESMNIP